MEKDMDTILDWCLDQMRKGKKIEDCLESYPRLASELRPLLHLAKDIGEIPRPEPRKEAINLTLMRVGEAVSAARSAKPFFQKISLHRFLARPAVAGALSTALVLMLIVWGVGMLAAGSLPGDFLYPVKLVTERAKFLLTRDAEGKAELRIEFSDERLDELIRTAEKTGTLDRSLLQSLLKEAELALDEARPVEEDTFKLLAARLDHFTAYQETALKSLKARVPAGDYVDMDKAIELCRRRCRCLKKMMEHKGEGDLNRQWDPGCRCSDLHKMKPCHDDSPQ
jgi:hypothetical protein